MFNASKAAFNPGKDFGPYALPKAAIVALTKQYALDYGQFEFDLMLSMQIAFAPLFLQKRSL